MTRAHKAFAVALGVVLVGLEVRAVIGPYEDWPFTSAPMFARYHAADAPLYEVDLVTEEPAGQRHVLSAGDLGLGELTFKRQLFARWYGSTDPRHPAGHHPGDTPAQFSARMAELCGRIARVYERRTGRTVEAFELEVRRLEEGRAVERRVVGRYDVASRHFERRVPP